MKLAAVSRSRLSTEVGPIDVGIICALRCEARPILGTLGLETSAGIFRRNGVALVVSGVGTPAAARGVARLREEADAATAWINVGCGGGRGEIGQLVVAHRVVGEDGESWYPQFPFPVAEPTAEVHSISHVETEYAETAIYEMEAAGFYAKALKMASLERVHVLKVRVDGPEAPVKDLSAKRIEAFMTGRVREIDAWVERLARIATVVRGRRPSAGLIDDYLRRWHFSASQQTQLRRVLERTLALGQEIVAAGEIDARTSREVLKTLHAPLQGVHWKHD